MARFITVAQYKNLTQIPRGRLAARILVFCGAIIEDKGKILVVKEAGKYGGWDFPGGKVLWSENVFECAVREVLEESGFNMKLTNLLGIYQRKTEEDDEEYFRFVFIGTLDVRNPKKPVKHKAADPKIEKIEWVSISDLLKNKVKVRSPEIIRELSDYKDGKKFPLSVVDLYNW